MHEEVVERIVEITSDLYDKQKQHTKFHHDQKYYGLRRVKDLFEVDGYEEDFNPVLVRQSFKGVFKEYEINGSVNVLTFKEYLDKIYLSLEKQIDETQKSEHIVILGCIVVF